MLDFPKWKVWSVTIVVLIGIVLSIPSLIAGSQFEKYWPGFLPNQKISLGLDLAGGSHLLLEADARDAQKQRLQAMEDNVATELRRQPRVGVSDYSTANGRVTLTVNDVTQVDTAVDRLRGLTQPVALSGSRDWDVQVVNGNQVQMIPSEAGSQQALKDAMGVARDVVRRRIDPGGTKEITVITEGDSRILVQVPGVEDPDALKRLIGQTARLEFKLVDQTADAGAVQAGRAPPGSQVLPMADGSGAIAVKRRVMVSGDQLVDAKPGFDQDNRPNINITFDSAGARRFARATQENTGKPFAIILDDKVLSAPNINEPILGGRAMITGQFTTKEANDLSVALASGKLPVKLNVIEERTVGPDLGKDSIQKGVIASVVGTLLIVIFMLVTYGRFGLYANIALLVNGFLILGIMALFNATLTLPGIAGFILTIGAAVDANVLINERIREELRRGRRIMDAVETGYREAFRAIFDANVTHVISAGIMAYFGSGPVRGFAVVLLIGVVTSVFTAVFFTRMLVVLWLKRTRPKTLNL